MDEEGKDPVFFTDFSGKVSKREIGFFHLSRIGFASNDVPEKKGKKRKKRIREWEHCSPSWLRLKNVVSYSETGLKRSVFSSNIVKGPKVCANGISFLLSWTGRGRGIFCKPTLTTKDTQLKWFQFRILHRLLPAGRCLYLRHSNVWFLQPWRRNITSLILGVSSCAVFLVWCQCTDR